MSSASNDSNNRITIILNGTRETLGRSLVASSIIGLLAIGLIYFAGQILLTIFAAVPTLVAGEPDPSFSADDTRWFFAQVTDELRVAILLSQFLFMLVPVVVLVRRWHTVDVAKYIRLRPRPLLASFAAVIATFGIIPFGTYVAGELTSRMEIPNELAELTLALFTANSLGEFVFLLVVIAVTPAICEEVFFRGFVQRTLERAYSWHSVIIVGVLFGLFHLQPVGLVATTIMGIAFGYFYYRSRSLLPSMLAHFANNALVVSLIYFDPIVNGVHIGTSDVIPFSWVLISLPFGLGGLALFHLMTRHTPEEVLLRVTDEENHPDTKPFPPDDFPGADIDNPGAVI